VSAYPSITVQECPSECVPTLICVSSAERTIVVLDALARALDARGLKIEPLGNCMRMALPPDSLTFSLVERIEKRNHVPTVEELAREERRRKMLAAVRIRINLAEMTDR
jgi:hypothetical protein